MLPNMEAKHPFSDQDWQATPEPVRQYIRQLEQTIAVLVNKVKELEKRTEKLESKAKQIKILKIPVNHHHLTAHLANQRKKEKRVSVKKELKKGTKAINKNYWNRLSNKISCQKNVIVDVQQSSLTVCSPTIHTRLLSCLKSK
jgi:hypothetical protein